MGATDQRSGNQGGIVQTDVTRPLASFAVTSKPGDVPAAVRAEGIRALVNWIGSPIGACRHPIVERAFVAFDEFSGPRQASLLGRGNKLDIFNAALINCIASGIYDYDDTHLPTVIHPTGPIASALLALCQYKTVTGRDFLHALVLGIEVQCRLASALAEAPAECDGAWFLTGITGGVGTAVATGRILGLNEQQMIWAIGIAAARASGTRATHGSMSKNLVPAWAAEEGMKAAFLARRDFTASDVSLEGPRGLGHLYARKSNFAVLVDGLGEHWALKQNAYKPFPSGIVTHGAITGALELVQQHCIARENIDRVELVVHPLCIELCGRRTPRTAVEGTFSVFHWVAVALLNGVVSIRQFSDACVTDSVVIGIRDRVTATTNPQFKKDEAHVRLILIDGRVLEHHVDHALGSAERPMRDAELDAKFHDLADGVLGVPAATQLLHACRNLERLPDAARLVTP
ncbi:MAG: MmgE/PrpD family protein [Burkholderiales bacterium]